jgi:DNA-binding NtrC family response regulator
MSEEDILQNQAKVLIIDDERLLRQSIKKILEKTGFYCETAMDYPSAKKSIENLKFDLILVDIVLPKMSGIHLITNLKKEYELNAAIIFITGEPNLETAVRAMRIGASDYLEKPVSRNVLVESIKRSLIQRKQQLKIIKEDGAKTITLDESFLNPSQESIGPQVAEKFENSVLKTHDALVQLKKKYGDNFNEDQRTLLNIIAQNNTAMKKLLRKLED